MKAMIFYGSLPLKLEERAIPAAGSCEVTVEVSFAGICGSDLFTLTGRNPRVHPPIVLGHEFVGRVVQTGAGVDTSLIGKRVAIYPLLSCGKCYACLSGNSHICLNLRLIGVQVDGGFAEYVKVPASSLVEIPDILSDECAALTEPVAVALHAVRKSSLQQGEKVVIIGGGPIGLLVGLNCMAKGAGRIIVLEKSKERLQLAEEMGFEAVSTQGDNVISRVEALLSGGPDVTFDCAGKPATTNLAIEITKAAGRIVIVGLPEGPTTVDLLSVQFKEIVIYGSRVYRHEDFLDACHMLNSFHGLPWDKVISKVVTFRKMEESIRDLYAGKGLKVLVRPTL